MFDSSFMTIVWFCSRRLLRHLQRLSWVCDAFEVARPCNELKARTVEIRWSHLPGSCGRRLSRSYTMPPTDEPDTWDSTNTAQTDVTCQAGNADSIWIFGYGSLIWKTNFPYSRKISGYITGFMRRFWQGSTDHRGVPGNPGRVVTLIPKDEEITWGMAYQVLPASVPEVMAYLNHREKGGYSLHSVDFHPKEAGLFRFPVYVYIATEDNEEFLGDAPPAEIAKQIAASVGPSGYNSEYLLELAKAVRKMGVQDEHLFDLEKRVREELINRVFSTSLKQEEQFRNAYSSSNKAIILNDKDIDRQE